jgi:hypothetical protein
MWERLLAASLIVAAGGRSFRKDKQGQLGIYQIKLIDATFSLLTGNSQ